MSDKCFGDIESLSLDEYIRRKKMEAEQASMRKMAIDKLRQDFFNKRCAEFGYVVPSRDTSRNQISDAFGSHKSGNENVEMNLSGTAKKARRRQRRKMNRQIKRQEERLKKQNLEDEHYKRVNSGRINKPNKSQSAANEAFFEKGSFVYKFRNTSNKNEVMEIVRNKPDQQMHQNQNNNSAININIDFNGLFEGVAEFMKPSTSHGNPPSSTNNQKSAKNASRRRAKLLQDETDPKLKELDDMLRKSHENDDVQVKYEPISFSTYAMDAGIQDMDDDDGIEVDNPPAHPNMPFNLRFA